MRGWLARIRNSHRGFTIVEILIVIAVIGVLAAITIYGFGAAANNAHDSSVKSDLQKIDDAFKQYALDNEGVFPNTYLQFGTLGVKLSINSYYTGNRSNIYLCYNPTYTEFAVVSMSLSGKRFVLQSEKGISTYTGSVVWDATTGNWTETCASVDPSYAPAPGNLAGMEYDAFLAWTGGSTAITNLAENPSFENDLASVGPSAVATTTMNRSTDWSSDGSYSVEVVPSSASSSNSYVYLGCDNGSSTPCANLQYGKTYTISVQQYIPEDLVGTLDPEGRAACVVAYQYVGAFSFTSAGCDTTAGERRLTLTFTIAENSTKAFIRLYNGGMTGAGSVYYDAIMLTEGPTTYYYADGVMNGWIWNGSPYNSTSTGPIPKAPVVEPEE